MTSLHPFARLASNRSFRILAKAVLAILLATLPALAWSEKAPAQDKFKVVATFSVIADIARNVAGDAAEVVSITKPGAELHTYQPTPGDILKAQGSGLILRNGWNLEARFEKFFHDLRGVPNVVVTRGISPMDVAQGPYRGKPNPHAWMSPRLSLIYVDNIAHALATHDPANSAIYAANAARYKAEIRAVADAISARLESIAPERRWLATSEGAFSYFARDFGLRELYIWPINADQQGGPQQLRRVIDAIKRHKIPAIFSESTVSGKAARQIARETGIRYAGVLYADSLTGPDGPAPTFLDLLRANGRTIVAGLR